MAWAYLVVLVVLVGMLFLSMRNRRRQALADADRAQQIGVGTEVMTTSGLYGTVVAKGEDGTVQLSIAPGVEVKWALAALRDVASLPDQFQNRPGGPAGRGGIYDRPDDGPDGDPDNRDS